MCVGVCERAGASALTLPWDWMAALNVSDKPSAAATNQSPPNAGENNESRPAGIQRCVSALRCVCAGLDGGTREERMLWRLEIY